MMFLFDFSIKWRFTGFISIPFTHSPYTERLHIVFAIGNSLMNASNRKQRDILIKSLPSANLVYDSHPTIIPPSFVNIVEFLRAHWAMNNDVCQQIQLGDYSLWKSECTWTFWNDEYLTVENNVSVECTGHSSGSAHLLCYSTICYVFSFFLLFSRLYQCLVSLFIFGHKCSEWVEKWHVVLMANDSHKQL